MKSLSWISLLLLVVISGCAGRSREVGQSEDSLVIREDSLDTENNRIIELFGVKTECDDLSVLRNLESEGIIHIDSLALNEDNDFKFAIVEFASVKFGVNPGLNFITSRHDRECINALVDKISSYYGEPEVSMDSDDDEPQYHYYKWNPYDPEKPYIIIRPLHSTEGGLVMIW